jgi:hypothetical protein
MKEARGGKRGEKTKNYHRLDAIIQRNTLRAAGLVCSSDERELPGPAFLRCFAMKSIFGRVSKSIVMVAFLPLGVMLSKFMS